MKLRFLPVLLLPLFAVGVCNTLQEITSTLGTASSFTLTQAQIDAAHETYKGGVLVWVSAYASLYDKNPCKLGQHATLSNVCAEYPVLVQLQNADKVVAQAFTTLDQDYAACMVGPQAAGCSGLSSAYNTAQTAITAITNIAKLYGYTPAA